MAVQCHGGQRQVGTSVVVKSSCQIVVTVSLDALQVKGESSVVGKDGCRQERVVCIGNVQGAVKEDKDVFAWAIGGGNGVAIGFGGGESRWYSLEGVNRDLGSSDESLMESQSCFPVVSAYE